MPVSFPDLRIAMQTSTGSLVTGASGFVGRRLASALGGSGVPLVLSGTDWREALARAEWSGHIVYHLAARAHRVGDDDEQACEEANVRKTEALARAAAQGGARRLVFLSTIKVNGEETSSRPFTAADEPQPGDAYARSKWRAEQALARVAHESGLEVVIVRSPLVVGPAARGNLAALLRIADSTWPLPFAAIANRRTFIALDDLAALLLRCAELPEARGRTFLAGDPDAVSTPRLLRTVRAALGRPARLIPVPAAALEAAATLGGQGERMRRLTRSLEVDSAATCAALSWSPRKPIDEALREMATAWKVAQ